METAAGRRQRPSPNYTAGIKATRALPTAAKPDVLARPLGDSATGVDHEDSGLQSVGEVAATEHGARSSERSGGPGHAHIVVAEAARPARTVRRERHPVINPLDDIPDHVEDTNIGDAVRPGPVRSGDPPVVLQSDEPGVTPGSGVPRAAACHFWLARSRFPELRAVARA
jgi:hypothetical protein